MSAEGSGFWYPAAQRLPSTNANERPDGVAVSLLVIHCISLPPGEFGTGCVAEFFTNRLDFDRHPSFESIRDTRVSAHLMIERTGALTQFVPFDRRAWHAGVSWFRGREHCNDFSIGIELEGTVDGDYTAIQYRQLAAVTRALITRYPELTADRIAAHSEIAPERKEDPGPRFDWSRYRELLRG